MNNKIISCSIDGKALLEEAQRLRDEDQDFLIQVLILRNVFSSVSRDTAITINPFGCYRDINRLFDNGNTFHFGDSLFTEEDT